MLKSRQPLPNKVFRQIISAVDDEITVAHSDEDSRSKLY